MTAEDRAKLKKDFDRDGYLFLPGVFNTDEVRRMREEADAVLELIVNSSLAHRRKSRRLDLTENAAGTQTVLKIQPINDLSLFLSEISRDQRFLGPLAAVMGDEPELMEEKLNYKEPLPSKIPGIGVSFSNDRFPIHSDWAYYKHNNYPTGIISSAIVMDDCREESGPLRVWPGSHLSDLEHVSVEMGFEVKPGLIDRNGGINMLAPAGSVLLFHALLIHNSRPNTSGKPRRLMIYSHFPKSAEMCFDVRNGPTRLAESPYEWEYQRMKNAGRYTDTFEAPVFT